jgi:hypothetical protein
VEHWCVKDIFHAIETGSALAVEVLFAIHAVVVNFHYVVWESEVRR